MTLMSTIQEYISTTFPMLVNTLMQLVSTVVQRLVAVYPDDASQTQTLTLSKFIVRTSRLVC